ncbi:hypothetical protein CC86DRAFT_373468 [Ophiobolus disseminans]|uniref:Uncharacterized protein n=1 Tax=Ophiobolus disseminans TaxID=1469910 RepID=A0A6A6ZLI3_9PLEO|nr:hypothetical protein CC86DRAFT_373468 [Ophiobolus disseminans]
MPSNNRHQFRSAGMNAMYPNATRRLGRTHRPWTPPPAPHTSQPRTSVQDQPLVQLSRSSTRESLSDDDWDGISAEDLDHIADAAATGTSRRRQEEEERLTRRAVALSVIDAEEQEEPERVADAEAAETVRRQEEEKEGEALRRAVARSVIDAEELEDQRF